MATTNTVITPTYTTTWDSPAQRLTLVSPEAWITLADEPASDHVLDSRSFDFGPLGAATRSIRGSLATELAYDLRAEHFSWNVSICLACDGHATPGPIAEVGGRSWGVYLLPPDANEISSGNDWMAVDDASLRGVLVAVAIDDDADAELRYQTSSGEVHSMAVKRAAHGV